MSSDELPILKPRELVRALERMGFRLLRKPRRPEVLPYLTLSLGLQRAPESWRDYLLWDVSLDQA